MRTLCGGSAPGGGRGRGSLEGAGDSRPCRLLRAAWAVVGLVALLAVIVAVDAQADRRRRSTTFSQSSETSWPVWDGVTVNPELTDAHPTTGWPTEFGRICVTFTSGPSGEHRAIIDGRIDGDDPRPYLSVVDDGRIRFGIQTVGSIAGGEIIPFHTHTACIDRTLGTTTLILDGQTIGTSTTLPAWDWHPTARLGSRYGDADPLGGTIASIKWRGLRMTCDMRSDTCSDGRKITTTRATPVPCETSPGVWEIVPADVGCYSVRGLESWVATTSYLSFGAELDRSPWIVTGGGTITPLVRGYRLSGPVGSSVVQNLGNVDADTEFTFACILRGEGQARLQFGGPQVITLSPDWAQYSRTVTISQGGVISPRIYTGDGSATADPVDIMGCWLTRTDTPGRPCWGGEAPVTCAADRHTISTEGWPTTEGEICITANVEASSTLNRWLIDGRGSGALGNTRLFVRSGTNALALLGPQGTIEGGVVAAGPRRLCVRASDGTGRLTIDGVVVAQGAMLAPMAWFPMATIGSAFPAADGSEINGSISSLTVRSYEEVSP